MEGGTVASVIEYVPISFELAMRLVATSLIVL